jgi:hypothetical protein
MVLVDICITTPSKALERVCLLAKTLAERMMMITLSIAWIWLTHSRWNAAGCLCSPRKGPHRQVLGPGVTVGVRYEREQYSGVGKYSYDQNLC